MMLNKIYMSSVDAYVVYVKGINTACVVKVNGKNHILIDADWDSSRKFWAMQHEIGHIRMNALYSANANEFEIMKKEREANDWMIQRNQLASKIIFYKDSGMEAYQICDKLALPIDIYNKVIEYLKRRSLKTMHNCVNLLCLKNNIDIHELAYYLGCSYQHAYDICDEKTIITEKQLNRLSVLFNVSIDKILCI